MIGMTDQITEIIMIGIRKLSIGFHVTVTIGIRKKMTTSRGVVEIMIVFMPRWKVKKTTREGSRNYDSFYSEMES